MPNPKAVTFIKKAKKFGEEGDDDKSLKFSNLTIQADLNWADGYVSRGVLLSELGFAEAAISDFDKAIELNFLNDFVLIQRADAYMQIDSLKKALSDLTKALEFAPENAEIYQMRGSIYIKMNNHRNAREDLSKAIELNPVEHWTYFSRATSVMSRN